MKRDFLRNLGIEDKEIIDKILDENSTDIGKAKGELETLQKTVKELEEAIKTKDTEIGTLQQSAKNVDDLNARIKQLETESTTAKTDYDAKLLEIKKSHAIENAVRDSKAKNNKAVMALLDMTKIEYKDDILTGVEEQLNTLKTGGDTNFLFDNTTVQISGTHPRNPSQNTGGAGANPTNLSDAIAAALKK